MTTKPILNYDFLNVSSTIVPDISGLGQAGVIRNYDRGGAVIAADSLFGREVSCIELPGGEGGGYLQAPDGVLQGNQGLTVNFWVRVNSVHFHDFLFSFGSEPALYLRLFPEEGNGEKARLVPCVTTGGRSQERCPEEGCSIFLNRWYMVTVTHSEDGVLACYVDGSLQTSLEKLKILPSHLADAKDCVFGYGLFAQMPSNVRFADIAIYPTAFSQEEVQDLFRIPASGRVEADAQALAEGMPAAAEKSIALPARGAYGSRITWSSDKPQVLSPEGTVCRPAPLSPDEAVTLTATLSYEDASLDRAFPVVVPAMPTDQQVVEMDLQALVLPDLSALVEDLSLPTKGENGTVFTWESSDPSVFSAEGKVTRPAEQDVSFTLKLTASFGGASQSREFPACVLRHYPVIIEESEISVQAVTAPGCQPILPPFAALHVQGGDPVLAFLRWESIPEEKLQAPGSFSVSASCPEYPTVSFRGEVTVAQDGAPETQGSFASLEEASLESENVLTDRYHQGLRYLRMLDADRMLYNFRATFGRDTKGAVPPGGWDEPMGLLRGHSTGHFLSALALAYSSSHDSFLKEKLDYMVEELADLQSMAEGDPEAFVTACTPSSAAQSFWSKDPKTWGRGFLSAYSPDQFALLEQFTPYATIWAPYYTLHKILAGLLDCYRLAGSEKALAIAEGIGTWVYRRLSACTQEQRSQMWSMYIAGEYGGFNESMASLYRLTGKKEYLETADMFYNPKLFDGLIENHDTISGLHANQHIPQIIGALETYAATGDKKYFRMARNFWHLVTGHYAYSIGGVGRGEVFKEPDILAGNIDSDRNCETCAAYNMLKLTLGLYAYDPDASYYMDYYERTLLNQIVASINPHETEDAHHGVTYMLPIGPGAHRGYSNDYHDFTCCHGTGMENHVKYQQAIYFTSDSGEDLYVNLYIPSHFHWKEKNTTLELSGAFPGETYTLKVQGGGHFRLHLRVPQWCKDTFRVETSAGQALPDGSGYVSLEGDFADGDVITVHTPYSLHLAPTQDASPEGLPVASVLYGPLVMVALSEDTETKTLVLKPDLSASFTVSHKGDMPVLESQGLAFVPMYAAHEVGYHVYFKIRMA